MLTLGDVQKCRHTYQWPLSAIATNVDYFLSWLFKSLKRSIVKENILIYVASNKNDLDSISSTFYARVFRTKLLLNFWCKNFKPKNQLCSFWRQNFVQKNARKKMLMKLTPEDYKIKATTLWPSHGTCINWL